MRTRPINCAHRGASGHAPENTLAALRLAVEQGADMAEIDVQLTADGRPVVIHDFTLSRTTDGHGAVADRTLAELQRLDAGAWFAETYAGERLPTLPEVLVLAKGRLGLNLELKSERGGFELADIVARAVLAAGMADSCLLTSFARTSIDWLAVHHPQLARGYILPRNWRTRDATVYEADVDVLSLERTTIDAEAVSRGQGAGKQIHAWTVNDADEMRRLMKLGVDALITNYPDRLQAVIAEPAG